MPFDLKAATLAAQTEAQRAPFEFEWGEESFSFAPMSSWPIEISASLASLAEQKPEDIVPSDIVILLRRIVGEDEWPRFARTVPMDAMPVLMEEMSKAQLGSGMADLSPRPEPALIQT